MAILSTDILFKLSTTSGAAGNSTAQPSPSGSLGKYISTTQITNATLDNLFGDITGAVNAASGVDYRCFFVHNNNAGITWINPVAWISAKVAGYTNIGIGLDPSGVSPVNQAAAQAATIANVNAAPVGVTFSSPLSYASGLQLANIPASSCAAIWVMRTALNNGAYNSDGVTITVQGDTTA